jgi:ABC-2 type transport system permease protein
VVLALIGLIGLLTASIAYAVALAVKSEDSYAPIVFTSALPILLLSGVLLPMSIAPQWLQNIAHLNPLLYAVDAARAIFNDHLGDASVVQGVLILIVLSIIAVVIGARQFGRAVA